MNVDQLAEKLRRDNLFMENVVRWEELPAREARYGDYPIGLDERLLNEQVRERLLRGESIEDACAVHGTDADELIEKINAYLAAKQ